MLNEMLEKSWRAALSDEFSKPYFLELEKFVAFAYENETVYPEKEKIFSAFSLTPFEKVKVVILGQDPYHEPGEAQGLAFYVPSNVKPPPSLRNIGKEWRSDLEREGNPDLFSWAQQGVLLLNTTLTVKAHEARSHFGKGWEIFTDAVIRELSARKNPLVFILWGKDAQQKRLLIDATRHEIIESAHPSPFSAYRGFFGARPFSRANVALERFSSSAIEW